MKNVFFKSMVFIALYSLVLSCSKDVSVCDEEMGTSSLRVMARAASASSGMTVASPVSIYVFDSGNKCVGCQTVDSPEGETDFKLAAGVYSVYAIAGASGENYDLAQQDEATPQTVVALKADKAHGDLMSGGQTVTLKEGEDNEASLQMKRNVLLLTEMIVSDVPDDMASITATISPLYENLTINGQYVGENGKKILALTKQGSTSTWRCDCNAFLLPSIGNAVVKFVFTTTAGKSKTFTYTSSKPLVANYKVSMNVNYIKLKIPTLKCVISGVEWGGTDNWEINADEKEFVDEDGSVEPGGDVSTGDETLKAGGIYKGCYILKAEKSGESTRLTLIAPKEKGGLKFTNGDQSSIKTAVEGAIGELAVAGISGWRLPTLDEVKLVQENLEAIRDVMLSNGMDNITKTHVFYYKEGNGDIKCYYYSRSAIDIPETGKTSIKLRPFVTVSI